MVNTLLMHCWHTVDTLLNNGWHRVDTQLTHSWHTVNNVDNWLYFRPQSLALSERNLLTHATTSGKAPSRFIWKATHFLSTSSPCSFNDHCLGGVPWDVWLDWVDQGERRVLQKERGLGFGTPPVQVVISTACPLKHKVNRCLARYSPRATTNNRPTNRAPNKTAWPGPNWPKMPILGQIWSFLGQKS